MTMELQRYAYEAMIRDKWNQHFLHNVGLRHQVCTQHSSLFRDSVAMLCGLSAKQRGVELGWRKLFSCHQ